ncbi:3937_t:CDS:10 [Ambispora gerdemannii]|uniref:Elongation factor 1 alpha-like protein n=1 Tax=Ambispora gerdemannii TaxID=144530 RepID=A0A9N8VZ25_9GLOM|nr:3937_t:CDS:10 [Ambispora gerdemannii]
MEVVTGSDGKFDGLSVMFGQSTETKALLTVANAYAQKWGYGVASDIDKGHLGVRLFQLLERRFGELLIWRKYEMKGRMKDNGIRALVSDDDAVFEEEGYYDDYGEGEMTPKQTEQMKTGLQQVRQLIGVDTGITDAEIENSLWYYYFDTKETINWLLGKIHKSQAEKSKSASSLPPTQEESPSLPPTSKISQAPAKKELIEYHHLAVSEFPRISKKHKSHIRKSDDETCSKRRVYDKNFVAPADLWSWYNVKWSCQKNGNSIIIPVKRHIIDSQGKMIRQIGLLGGADNPESDDGLQKKSKFKPEISKNRTGLASLYANDGLNPRKLEKSNSESLTSTRLASLSRSNTETSTSRPSLSALAQSSARQSNRPSLADLAKTASSSKEKSSLSSILSSKNKSNERPSLSSLAQKSLSQSSNRVSLTNIVQKRDDLPISQSTVQRSAEGIKSLLSSQTSIVQPPSKNQSLLENKAQILSNKNISTIPSLSSSAQIKVSMTNQIVLDTNSPVIVSENKENENMLLLSSNASSNSLIAPPSIFAKTIFAKYEDANPPPIIIDHFTFDIFSSGGNRKIFAFNQPSPDDIVMKAQSLKGGVRNIMKSSQQTSKSTEVEAEFIDDEDSIIEIIENEDDEQLRFDLSALNLALNVPAKPSTSKSVSSIQTKNSQSINANQPKIQQVKPPHKLANRIDVMSEYKKRTSNKESLNLVVIGHVDAGKSTLMGHLLYLLGEVNEKTIKKYERDSQKIGKSSFAYAWVLDETGEERSRGITMDIAITKFETEHRRFTLLDAPGHRDFIPNMISGAAQADVAILVVDATTGEFEAGFEANGQTKEHALLVRSLGVQQLVVAINKLDAVGWSKGRFHEIEGKLDTFLMQAGFKRDKVRYIPCSGLTGENLLTKSEEKLDWYPGPTLVKQIDSFEPPTRLLDKPFRLSVTDFFKGGLGGGGGGGVSVAGRIEAGTIQIGEQVLVVPGGEYGTVKDLNDESSKWAAAGDYILMTLSGLDIMQLSIGAILCSPSHPVQVTSHFLAQIVVFDVKVPITKGFPVILHHHSLDEPASIVNLIAVIDKSSGEVTKKNPRHLPKSTTATVEIKLTNRPIPLETFRENKDLGRITLRKGGDTVAAGVVIEIFDMPGADVLFAPDYTSVSFDFEDFVREELGLGLHGPDQICQAYLRGNCHKGSKCEFKHTNSAREKAVVCKHWLRGLCKKGDQCEFLHEFNMRKMPECWFYSRYGECSNEDCMYLHIDPESKIKECAWYARGFCKHGPNCRHKHVRKVVCQLYLTGFCPKGLNCPNGHPKYELPSVQRAESTTSKSSYWLSTAVRVRTKRSFRKPMSEWRWRWQ